MMNHERTTPSWTGMLRLLAVCGSLSFLLCRVVAADSAWSLDLQLEPDSPPTIGIRFETETIPEAWTLALVAELEGAELNKVEFNVDGGLGDLLFDSELEFDSGKDPWKHWKTAIEWSCDSMTFSVTATLARSTDWLTLEMERDSGGVDVEARLRLRAPKGSCSFVFYDADLDVGFTWCGIESAIALAFDDDGFDELVLEWSDVTLGPFPWVFLDVEVSVDLDAWGIEFDPTLSVEIEGCPEIEINAELVGFPHVSEIRGAEIVASWTCEPWENEATIRLDPDDWIDDAYWLEIESELDIDLVPCGEFSTTIVLDWTQTALARIETESAYRPTAGISLGVAAAFDLETRCIEGVEFTLEYEW